MEKRLPLALFLCFLVLVGWRFLVPPPARPAVEPQAQPGAPATSAPAVAGSSAPAGAGDAPSAPAEPVVGTRVVADEEQERTFRFGTPGQRGSYVATFTNRGARIVSLRIGDWYDAVGLDDAARRDEEHWVELLSPVDTGAGTTASLGLRTSTSSADLTPVPFDDALWVMSPIGDPDSPSAIEFVYQPGRGVRFTKRIEPIPGTYEFRVTLALANEGYAQAKPATFVFTPAACMKRSSDDSFYQEPQAFAVGRKENGELVSDEELVKPNADFDDRSAGLDVGSARLVYAGVHNKYFATLVAGADPDAAATLAGAQWRRVRDADWVHANPTKEFESQRWITTDVILQLAVPPQGESRSWSYEVYLGPKDHEALTAANPAFDELVRYDLGFFASVASVLLSILRFFEGLVGNWGVAIILLTLTVRACLFPINRRSQTAMARYQKKMKRVQPKIDELKKRYEKDPQKLRQEQAKLMQEEGAFPPLGGCLPMFLQLPVFIGLFAALRTNFDLRQQPFALWIQDLSAPDRLLPLGWTVPLVGWEISHFNLLPLLMIGLWIGQQRMMPTPTDEQAARMQKMMMWMPILFGVMLYNYAAGLSLYMITGSCFAMIEMGFIKKKWPIDDTEPEPKKKTGFMAKLAEAQKEQMRRMEAQQRAKKSGGGGGGSKKQKKQRKARR